MVEQDMFVGVAFIVTFLVLGVHLFITVRQAHYTRRALSKQFVNPSRRAMHKRSISQHSIHSAPRDKGADRKETE